MYIKRNWLRLWRLLSLSLRISARPRILGISLRMVANVVVSGRGQEKGDRKLCFSCLGVTSLFQSFLFEYSYNHYLNFSYGSSSRPFSLFGYYCGIFIFWRHVYFGFPYFYFGVTVCIWNLVVELLCSRNLSFRKGIYNIQKEASL